MLVVVLENCDVRGTSSTIVPYRRGFSHLFEKLCFLSPCTPHTLLVNILHLPALLPLYARQLKMPPYARPLAQGARVSFRLLPGWGHFSVDASGASTSEAIYSVTGLVNRCILVFALVRMRIYLSCIDFSILNFLLIMLIDN